MAKYNPTLGIYGNIKKLFTEHNSNRNQISNNKAQADTEMLNIMADTVEAVVDEYLTVVGEEREEQDV